MLKGDSSFDSTQAMLECTHNAMLLKVGCCCCCISTVFVAVLTMDVYQLPRAAYLHEVKQLLLCKCHQSLNLLCFSPEVVYAEGIHCDGLHP